MYVIDKFIDNVIVQIVPFVVVTIKSCFSCLL